MIYLKRTLKVILFCILLPIVLISLLLTHLLYPFYLILHYIVYGDLGMSFEHMVYKVLNIILKPLDF